MAIVKHRPFCRRGHSFELVGRTPAGACRECARHITKKWQANQPLDKRQLQKRAASLRHNYNLNLEDWDRLFAQQNGQCAICDRHQSELNHVLCVDHDHVTGKVRGLLCMGCNGALGYFEKIETRKRMSEYLDRENR